MHNCVDLDCGERRVANVDKESTQVASLDILHTVEQHADEE